MKKILLGMMALSAVAMAEGTDLTPIQPAHTNSKGGSAEVDITTKAFIMDGGLMITGTEDGTVALSGVELNHGTIMKGQTTSLIESKEIFIRKSTSGAQFPANALINITLNAKDNNGNNLVLTAGDTTSSLPHILTAAITNGAQERKDLKIAGSTTSDNADIKTSSGATFVKVILNSELTAGAIQGTELEGEHINVSTLEVKLSKVPSSVSTRVPSTQTE